MSDHRSEDIGELLEQGGIAGNISNYFSSSIMEQEMTKRNPSKPSTAPTATATATATTTTTTTVKQMTLNTNFTSRSNATTLLSSSSSGEMKRMKNRVTFPKARIKKIMQQDEEIGKIAAPVPILLSRCLELFIADLVKGTSAISKKKNAKTMSLNHFKECIESNEKFDFLREKVQHISSSSSSLSPKPGDEEEEVKPKRRRASKNELTSKEPAKKRGRKKKEPSSPREEASMLSSSSSTSPRVTPPKISLPAFATDWLQNKTTSPPATNTTNNNLREQQQSSLPSPNQISNTKR
jgi:hypothetical protein